MSSRNVKEFWGQSCKDKKKNISVFRYIFMNLFVTAFQNWCWLMLTPILIYSLERDRGQEEQVIHGHLQVAVTRSAPTLDGKTRHFHAALTITWRTTNSSTGVTHTQAPARFTNISSNFVGTYIREIPVSNLCNENRQYRSFTCMGILTQACDKSFAVQNTQRKIRYGCSKKQ
jgi:hypothetical protein